MHSTNTDILMANIVSDNRMRRLLGVYEPHKRRVEGKQIDQLFTGLLRFCNSIASALGGEKIITLNDCYSYLTLENEI